MSRLIIVLAAVSLAVGGVAYAGGGDNQGSGVHAWALVNPNGGSPVLVKAKGFVAVRSPGTGVYCLRAAPGISLPNSAPVASQETNLSTTLGFVTVRRADAPQAFCRDGELHVNTWDAASPSSPTAVNTVAFDVIVP